MKLHELFEPSVKDIKINNHKMDFDGKIHAKNKEHLLGKGHFSAAYNHKTDPHMIDKISHDRFFGEIDLYWNYVNQIIKSEIWKSNPHFPRFYSIKKYNDGREILYKGTMEKLVDHNQIDTELLVNYINNNFFTIQYDENDDQHEILKTLCSTLAMLRNDFSHIKNSKIREALEFISNSCEKMKHCFLDLKPDNLMFRRNSYGIDIVFTDPLAS